MLHALNSLLAPAVMERVTLLVNHVLDSEPVATGRMKAHSGKTLQVTLQGWPALLPAPPPMGFRITPAGLVEWCGPERDAVADLSLRVDAANPALLLSRTLGGAAPEAVIDGDAALAADVNWLLQNLRWDIADDLGRVLSPAVAAQLQRLGRSLAGALRGALQLGGKALGPAAERARWRSP